MCYKKQFVDECRRIAWSSDRILENALKYQPKAKSLGNDDNDDDSGDEDDDDNNDKDEDDDNGNCDGKILTQSLKLSHPFSLVRITVQKSYLVIQ